jgi:hypothetical protein
MLSLSLVITLTIVADYSTRFTVVIVLQIIIIIVIGHSANFMMGLHIIFFSKFRKFPIPLLWPTFLDLFTSLFAKSCANLLKMLYTK